MRGEWQVPDLLCFFSHRYPFLSQLPLVFFESRALFLSTEVYFPLYCGCKTTGYSANTYLTVGHSRAKPGHCRHHNTWITLKWNRQVCQVLSPPPSLQFTQFIPNRSYKRDQIQRHLFSFNTFYEILQNYILYILANVTGFVSCHFESDLLCHLNSK